MKAEITNRIQDAFRAGKGIDSAIKRAASFAKKTPQLHVAPEKKKPVRQSKPVK